MNNNYEIIDLKSYYNNNGISYKDEFYKGNFTGMGTSFPAEQLPESNSLVTIEGIPFFFPDKREENNLDFNNQLIHIPKGEYERAYFLGASENGSFRENLQFVGNGILFEKKLGLSDWIALNNNFGDKIAFRTNKLYTTGHGELNSMNGTIWVNYIDLLDINRPIEAIKLDDNPGIRIFSITLKKRDYL